VGTLVTPRLEAEGQEWPTLGFQVALFIEQKAVYGPGSLKGEPYVLDDEKRGAIYRMYEVYPKGHEYAGRRRFKRVGLSWRKGTAKTEFAAIVAFCELHPDAPVRCDGFDANGQPVGRPVRDPYIPMVAYNVDQVEELAYGALKTIIAECEDADLFDIGTERILRMDGAGRPDGKAVVMSGSPSGTDGARTTFQHFDETHRMELPRLIAAHETMLANIPKRVLDDAWTMETTTAGRPGAGSVAEKTHREAMAVIRGEIKDPDLFYFHREAGSGHDLKTIEGRIAAISEATGPVGEYGPGQFKEIARQWDRPGADKTYLERVWLNRWTRSDQQAFDVGRFDNLGDVANVIKPGSLCTLGFDGARFRDSTAFVLTEVETGIQVPVGLWERPEHAASDWEVPHDEVNEKFHEVMETYQIWQVYADPPHWTEDVGKWAGKYPDKVTEWWTHNRRKIGMAVRAYAEAIDTNAVRHNGDPDFVRHVGSAGRVETNLLDDEGKKVVILGKIRPEAKFDMAMAAVLSWQARLDALAEGAKAEAEAFIPYRLDRGRSGRSYTVDDRGLARPTDERPSHSGGRRPTVTYGPPR
jgi:hypothetical protein